MTLQAHDPEVARAIDRERVNTEYLPGVTIDRHIQVTSDPSETVSAADAVLLAVPAQHMRSVLRRCAAAWRPGVPAVICAKGIEQNSCALMSEVIDQTLPKTPICVLSGPSFAVEVARELPTAVTLASADPRLRESLPAALGTPPFRIYSSDDVIGAQLGGAIKNVLAIACGIVEGKRLGDNGRAALITRGLAEMARFAVALRAHPETLTGLTGLGDLVLTCNAMQSRNFSLGVALGEGRPLTEILARADYRGGGRAYRGRRRRAGTASRHRDAHLRCCRCRAQPRSQPRGDDRRPAGTPAEGGSVRGVSRSAAADV